VGKRAAFTAEQTLQRNRDGLAYISKQFVRYGLTSVHHEGGDLFALQQVRARGDLLHRVSYEASGKVLEAMIEIAKAQRVSVGEVFASAFVDQLASWERLQQRAAGGNREKFLAVLDRVPGTEPEDQDRL
jgi:hypothetical protein